MSEKWPGGFIQPVPPTPTGPLANGSATGVWTVDQMSYWLKQGLWPIAGNFLYIEDVFSTYLYTGNGSTQTITNGIDLSTKGGLVWLKRRDNIGNHGLFSSNFGDPPSHYLISNSTGGQSGSSNIVDLLSNGFSVNGSIGDFGVNNATYASWTFREQPKFFDIVTYSGDSVDNRQISHNLGSTPGCVIVRRLSGDDWFVYHRSLAANNGLRLNKIDAASSNTSTVKSVSSTTFTVGTDGMVNTSGSDYVAYLFAHDAGGFGLTGSDNVITCGSWTNNGSGNASVTLGYEPQWILWKRSDSTSDWYIFDTMRGWTGDPNNSSAGLRPNLSNAENSLTGYAINSTGFSVAGVASASYIYIAIRRGPMKTPTSGTSVFEPDTYTGNNSTQVVGSDVLSDLYIAINRSTVENKGAFISRLVGGSKLLVSTETSAEQSNDVALDRMTGIGLKGVSNYGYYNESPKTYVGYNFRRAPGFVDVVCYTGTGSNTTVTHNLGVAPELMIVKSRSEAGRNWAVYSATLNATKWLKLNLTDAEATASTLWNDTAPTSSVFSVGASATVNANTYTFVAYLFATCAGVSKVGSYTGTGTTLQVNCGFTNGSRFVLIKRTDSTGDWYVWDSARGIVAGNDPYLLLNSTAAEVTNTDYVDTYSAGFEISSTAPAAINANGGTFIFLAIA